MRIAVLAEKFAGVCMLPLQLRVFDLGVHYLSLFLGIRQKEVCSIRILEFRVERGDAGEWGKTSRRDSIWPCVLGGVHGDRVKNDWYDDYSFPFYNKIDRRFIIYNM